MVTDYTVKGIRLEAREAIGDSYWSSIGGGPGVWWLWGATEDGESLSWSRLLGEDGYYAGSPAILSGRSPEEVIEKGRRFADSPPKPKRSYQEICQSPIEGWD